LGGAPELKFGVTMRAFRWIRQIPVIGSLGV